MGWHSETVKGKIRGNASSYRKRQGFLNTVPGAWEIIPSDKLDFIKSRSFCTTKEITSEETD